MLQNLTTSAARPDRREHPARERVIVFADHLEHVLTGKAVGLLDQRDVGKVRHVGAFAGEASRPAG